ncbi:hypothetical protein CH330_02050 [candidate division WOR-3 bacterium JGI_Cruoil_03_51_56]|uniref:Uncharacterized protein n=1 Tax=candidate division WOR-3 bacterium JGI_Cruoil_03_51_56 TaxID=1973747 RepID=A0A235BY40_UNCW3|nr:MAG: hypothetical protein CH330_02050 [candidate division WOR-3 bacterium JGI_Cruoil_03_51_56]
MLLVLMAACEQEKQQFDPNYREPMINGFLYRMEYYDGSVSYSRQFDIFDNAGLRMVPIVKLNQETISPYYYAWTNYRYEDTLPFRVYEPYELSVTHYWGEAFSRVVMPGNFCLTSPPGDSYVFDMESTLVVRWKSSAGVQWYWIDLYCDYDFLDSNYNWDDYSFNLDTTITDTYVIVPSERVFPSYVMDVLEGDGSVLVWAGYGPEVEPGDLGNVRGAGFGFVNAVNEPCEKYFYVGAPIAARRSPDARESLAKLVGLLRKRVY